VIRRLRTRDEGQLVLLTIGVTLLVALLVTVVVNASRVFLGQRALSAAADGAALAAADALDESAFYGAVPPTTLPLSEAAAAGAVSSYVDTAALTTRFDRFSATSAISADGSTVSVTCSAVVALPFLNVVSARYADGVPLSVTASARSPLRP
jgi:uncharacterized membrane protein